MHAMAQVGWKDYLLLKLARRRFWTGHSRVTPGTGTAPGTAIAVATISLGRAARVANGSASAFRFTVGRCTEILMRTRLRR